jgi:hypothetical protein
MIFMTQTKAKPLGPVQGRAIGERPVQNRAKPAMKPLDPMLSKYEEEGILGFKPGTVKVDNKTEIQLQDLPKLEEARAKEKETQFLHTINAVREKVREEYETLEFTAEKNQMLIALSGIILPIGVAIGMYRSIELINTVAIPVVILTAAAAWFAFYVSHRIESKKLKDNKSKYDAAGRVLDWAADPQKPYLASDMDVAVTFPAFKKSMEELPQEEFNALFNRALSLEK